jgi:phospholipid/cholesterol/gamma-HCH transport system substrate-binding protein
MSKLLSGLGLKAYGIGFLALCLLAVWLTHAAFTKRFSSYDEVTLKSSKIGLSLPSRADVKIRGVLVGEVLDVDSGGDGAELTLGLYPSETETIPANTTAQILPKTLFGEKYVALQVPDDPQGSIEAGDTIEQGNVAIEVEEVLNDLFPLLRSIKPAELNYTLTAIANALEGRGDKIGEGLETMDSYLKRQNPEMPALLDSIDKLGKVSSLYNSIVPDLTRLLRNSVTTMGTLESKEEELQALFTDVAGFSRTTKQFLRKNGDNMIRLANQGAQILPLLAKYAPEYNCLFRGIVGAIPRQEEAFRNKTLHIILEVLPRQPRGYNAGDQPRYNDKRGSFPFCNLMYKSMRGGFNQDNLPPERLVPRIRDGVNYPIAKRVPVNDAVGGTLEDRTLVNAIASPVMGVHVDDVPDVTTLLLGPLTRGTEVNLR